MSTGGSGGRSAVLRGLGADPDDLDHGPEADDGQTGDHAEGDEGQSGQYGSVVRMIGGGGGVARRGSVGRGRRRPSRKGGPVIRMETSAWKHPETRRSFQRYRRSAWWWLGSGAVGAVGCPWTGILADEAGMGWLGSVMAVLWVIFLTAALFGLCLVFNAARMRRRLRRHPWTAYPVGVRPAVLAGPVVRLRPSDGGKVFVQSVVSLNFRWHLVQGSATLWFCGVPGRGGVLAPPGGAPLLWARRVRIPWVRRRLERAHDA